MDSNYLKELAKLISIGPIVIYTCEAFGDFAATSITPNILDQLGYSPEEFLETPGFWASNIHPDDREKIFADLGNLFENGTHSHEYRFLDKAGKYRWMHDELRLILNDTGEPETIVGYWTDITKRKESEEMVRFMSDHDLLTSLPNRKLLNESLNRFIATARRNSEKFAVLFLDLDDFKPINDLLGHSAGDESLKIIAKRMKSLLRETDTVARIGGDEFIILLSNITSKDDVFIKVQEIIDSISEVITIEGNELYVSASVGISIYPEDADTDKKLISLADHAMYRAKAKGKKRFHFSVTS